MLICVDQRFKAAAVHFNGVDPNMNQNFLTGGCGEADGVAGGIGHGHDSIYWGHDEVVFRSNCNAMAEGAGSKNIIIDIFEGNQFSSNHTFQALALDGWLVRVGRGLFLDNGKEIG